MEIVKEPKGIDMIIKSEPWTDKELSDFRKIMQKGKEKSKIRTKSLKSKRKHVTI